MKPKETQVLGLLITALISLIVFDLYTIYCITSYIKLTSLDVTTSFAVMDALFYQTIKLIILSYGIFALVVEIRGIYILRDRRNAKLSKLLVKEAEDIASNYKKPVKHEHSYTIQDLGNECKVQETASNINFDYPEDSYSKELLDRYGYDALKSLTRGAYLNLSIVNIEARLNSLRHLRQFYINTGASGVADEYLKYWQNCVKDIKSLKSI